MTDDTAHPVHDGNTNALPRTSRRHFLIATSAVAAGALLVSGDVASRTGLELLRSAEGPRIPVAYLSGSAGVPSLPAALAAGLVRTVAAVGMRPSSEAGGEALVSFQGFASEMLTGVDVDRRFDRVLVDALVPSPVAVGQTLPFYAWTYRRLPTPSHSPPSTLRIAPARDLRVGVRLTTGAGAGSDAAMTTVFSSRRHSDVPTLRSGVYLLGLDADAWSAPMSLPALDDPAWRSLPATVMVVEERPDR